MRDELEQVLTTYVRPYLQSHNGELEVKDVTDGVVTIKLIGACSGCPSADQTASDFIEQRLSEHLKDFKMLKLTNEVSPELLDMAKSILRKA